MCIDFKFYILRGYSKIVKVMKIFDKYLGFLNLLDFKFLI